MQTLLKTNEINHLYTDYQAELRAYISRFLREEADIEDALQETFFRVCQSAENQQVTNTNMRAWLYRVARNLCLSTLSKRSTESRNLPLLNQSYEHFEKQSDDRFVLEEVLLFVEQAFNNSEQIIFKQRYLQSRTLDEIAADTSSSTASVFRINKKIQNRLKEEFVI